MNDYEFWLSVTDKLSLVATIWALCGLVRWTSAAAARKRVAELRYAKDVVTTRVVVDPFTRKRKDES